VVTLLSKGNAKADLAEVSGIICMDDATWEKWLEVSKKWLDDELPDNVGTILHGLEGRIGEFIRVHGVCILHRECSLSHLNLISFLLFLISPNSMLTGKYFNSTKGLV
jgi:hypothetical protein